MSSEPTSKVPKLTVSFNVGGKVYEVSKSLLNMHPESLLTKKASDATDEESSPIFIDRDPDRFSYCLDYMRDGKVHLPGNIKKKSLLLELKQFGFEDVDESVINDNAAKKITSVGFLELMDEERKKLEALKRQSNNLAQKVRMAELAFFLIQRRAGGNICEINEDDDIMKHYKPICELSLNESLSKFGFVSERRFGSDSICCFTYLNVEKVENV